MKCLALFSTSLMYFGRLFAVCLILSQSVSAEESTSVSQENTQAAAQRLLTEADQFRTQGKAEDLRQAVARYDQAAVMLEKLSDSEQEVTALNAACKLQYQMGEPKRAIERCEHSALIAKGAKNIAGEALALNNLGLAYAALGQKQVALEHYRSALALRQQIGDQQGQAGTLNNLGLVYVDLGEIEKALNYYNQALPIMKKLGNQYAEATILNNIGLLYSNIGEKEKALEYYSQALPIAKAVNARNAQVNTLNNLGILYSSLGEKRKAINYLNQALVLEKEIGDQRGESTTLNNIGAIYSQLGDQERSLEIYAEALFLARKISSQSNEARALENIGVTYRRLNHPEEAIENYSLALPLWRITKERSGEATTLINLGEIYAEIGNEQKADQFFSQAKAVAKEINNRELLFQSLALEAKSLLHFNHLNAAHKSLKESLSMVEALRVDAPNSDLRTSFFATAQEYYQLDIDVLMALHKDHPNAGFAAEALELNERQRARRLLDLLAESRTNIRQGVASELLEKEASLRQRLKGKQLKLQNLSDSDAKVGVQKEIGDLLQQFDALIAEIRNASPNYATLTQPQPLKLAQIQQQLDANTVLLEFSLGKEQGYLWAVTKKSLKSYSLPKISKVEAATRAFLGLVHSPTSPPLELQKAGQALSTLLLGHVVNQLGNKRLVIVADGLLQQVPFAALPSKNAEVLLDRHEIVSLPSTTTLATLRQVFRNRPMAPKLAAIFADPVFDPKDVRVTGSPVLKKTELALTRSAFQRSSEDLGLSGSLPRLQATRREADLIAGLAPGEMTRKYVDFSANLAAATEDDLSQFRMVHFATHGLIDPIHPEFSGLVLSLIDEKGQPQDGYLRLEDIYNLKLSAEVVVLSACESALGREVQGEGLIGLTRGFMYAGTPRVVASLWNVDDLSTAALMGSFYKGMLKDNLPTAAALRQAQLKLKRELRWQSPYYWAAFGLQGEWR